MYIRKCSSCLCASHQDGVNVCLWYCYSACMRCGWSSQQAKARQSGRMWCSRAAKLCACLKGTRPFPSIQPPRNFNNIERGRFTFPPCLAELCDLWIYRAFIEKADKSRSLALRFGTNHSSHILCSLKSEEIGAFLYAWLYFLNGCCFFRMNGAQQRMPLTRGSGRRARHWIYRSWSVHPSTASLFWPRRFHPPHGSFATGRRGRLPLFFLRNASLFRRRARRRPYQRPPSKTEWGLQREGWRASGASFKHSIAGESIRVNQNCQARNLTFDNKTKQIMQCAFPNSPADIRSTTETAVKRRANSFQVYPTVCCFLFFLSFFSPGVFNPPAPSLKPRISSRSALRQISLTSHSSLMVLTLMTLVRQEEKKLILLTF